MKRYRIRTFGLNDTDKSSLKSMLRLSAKQLQSLWELSEDGPADLSVYNFDNDIGKQAWRQRGPELTALLASHGNSRAAVDLILKKPLRVSDFAAALNFLDDRLSLASPETSIDARPHSEKTPWLKRLSAHLLGHSSPATDLPALQFERPTAVSTQHDSITDINMLNAWLQQLPQDSNQRVTTLLGHLQALNRVTVKASKRLALNEAYRETIRQLLFERDIAAVRRDMSVGSEHLKIIRNIGSLTHELSLGYQLIATDYYQSGQRPDNNANYLFALIRSAEADALYCLHQSHHYRPLASAQLLRCHQLWLYLEAADSQYDAVNLREGFDSPSFFQVYAQLLVTLLADPHALGKFEALRLYRLMADFADNVQISQSNGKQAAINNAFLLTGHFCIDTSSGRLPQAMARCSQQVRTAADTRLLNTQPLLQLIDRLLNSDQGKLLAKLDLQLLQQIIPQLNASYERLYHRLNQVPPRPLNLFCGLQSIHQALLSPPTNTADWQLLNQGSGGMLVSRSSAGCPALNIGDLVAVSESGLPLKLALVRWLLIDPDSSTQLGLQLCNGHAAARYCTPDGQALEHAAIELVDANDDKTATFFTEKGVYSPKRVLRIKGDELPFIIVAEKLLATNLDFDQFSYKRKAGS